VPVVTFEVNVLATTAPAVFRLPALALPVTPNDVSVPTDVILGWAAVVTVPAVVALGTAPVTLAPCMLDKLLPLPIKKLAVVALPKLALPDDRLPVTASELSVPTEVMFG
jgi:hypothetical protein